MLEGFEPNRYAVIEEKNPREIVLLRGSGCQWRRCRFCNYHLDCSPDPAANAALNREPLAQVTGCYGALEVINSGSFVDLDEQTMALIESVCLHQGIQTVHFESHWMHRQAIGPLRERFGRKGIQCKIKIGVETFDALFRECYLCKGIDTERPEEIAAYFDEACLLQGLPGQTVFSMLKDIAIGLSHFERVCVNLMTENGKPVRPDPRVVEAFVREIVPIYSDDPRVDLLLENTDFGVGGEKHRAK